MLRHVVMFKLNDDAPANACDSIEEGLASLARTIPEIEAYEYGSDLVIRDGNFDFCLVAEFADAAAFDRYVVHPEHQRFIQQRIRPVVAARVSVQYALKRKESPPHSLSPRDLPRR